MEVKLQSIKKVSEEEIEPFVLNNTINKLSFLGGGKGIKW